MKLVKKTGLLFVAFNLVVVFCFVALAEAKLERVKVESLSIQELKTKYSEADIQPLPLPKREFSAIDPQGEIEEQSGIPHKDLIHPGKMPEDVYLNETSSIGIEPQYYYISCPASYYTHIYDPDYYAWPTRAVGKLVGSTADGSTFWCTASVVSENVIVAAGHCVFDYGESYSDFVFIPGYYYGPTVYDMWEVENAYTYTQWMEDRDFRYDVAFLIMKPKYGLYVSDVIGGYLSFAADVNPSSRTYESYGYPHNLASAQVLSRTTADFGGYDYNESRPRPLVIGTNMQSGCSGGPWVYYRDGYGAVVNGVNSYSRVNCDYNIYSPYFSLDVWDDFMYMRSIQY